MVTPKPSISVNPKHWSADGCRLLAVQNPVLWLRSRKENGGIMRILATRRQWPCGSAGRSERPAPGPRAHLREILTRLHVLRVHYLASREDIAQFSHPSFANTTSIRAGPRRLDRDRELISGIFWLKILEREGAEEDPKKATKSFIGLQGGRGCSPTHVLTSGRLSIFPPLVITSS